MKIRSTAPKVSFFKTNDPYTVYLFSDNKNIINLG